MKPGKLSPRGNDPAAVERVAAVIYGVQVDTAQKLVAATEFDLDEMKRVMQVAVSETDRAAAILLFSYAEDRMLDGIKRHVNDDIKGGFPGLVSPNGLLAAAHDRITFLAALGWIDKPTYAALNLLRGIRNRFAHHVACDALSERTVSGMVTSLPDFERPLVQQMEFPSLDMRDVFLMRAILAVHHLMHDLAILPHAIAQQVSPRDLASGFDTGPTNLRELGLAVADCILLVVERARGRSA